MVDETTYRMPASQKLIPDLPRNRPLGKSWLANMKGAATVPSRKATASRRTWLVLPSSCIRRCTRWRSFGWCHGGSAPSFSLRWSTRRTASPTTDGCVYLGLSRSDQPVGCALVMSACVRLPSARADARRRMTSYRCEPCVTTSRQSTTSCTHESACCSGSSCSTRAGRGGPDSSCLACDSPSRASTRA